MFSLSINGLFYLYIFIVWLRIFKKKLIICWFFIYFKYFNDRIYVLILFKYKFNK